MKWCSYPHSNGHSSKDHYQQQSESANLDSKKIWCSYHKSRRHSDDEHHHQRNGSRNSFADSKNTKCETFVADSTETSCDKCSCNRKVQKRKCAEINDQIIRRLALGSVLQCVIPPYLKTLTASPSW